MVKGERGKSTLKFRVDVLKSSIISKKKKLIEIAKLTFARLHESSYSSLDRMCHIPMSLLLVSSDFYLFGFHSSLLFRRLLRLIQFSSPFGTNTKALGCYFFNVSEPNRMNEC